MRHTKLHLFFFALSIALFKPIQSIGQKDLSFRHYSIEHGLSQVTCMATLLDSNGFLWIGTQYGLNRFDGYTFKVFHNNPQDSTSINDSFILSLFEDSKGNIWVGTNGGLSLYNAKTESFINFQHVDNNVESLCNNQVWNIIETKDGNLWVGTDNGLDLFDYNNNTFVHYKHDDDNPNSISGNKIRSIFEDREGRLWIGTQNNGLNLFNNSNQTFKNFQYDENGSISSSQNYIKAINEDKLGNLWVGTENGLLIFDKSKNEFNHKKLYLKNNNITSIVMNSDSSLWVGSWFNGLYIFNYNSHSFINYKNSDSDNSSISSNRIMNIIEDDCGNKWIGTNNNGLNYFDQKNTLFEYKKHKNNNINSLSNNFVRCFAEDRDGNYWVGTSGGGLNKFNIKDKSVKHFTYSGNNYKSISNDAIRNLVIDRQGDIWIGTNGSGLDVFHENSQTFEHYIHNMSDSSSISSNFIQTMTILKNGNIMIGTREGLNEFDMKTQTFHRITFLNSETSPLISNTIWSFLEDRNGHYWIGTQKGLVVFNPQTHLYKYFLNDKNDNSSINNNYIKTIHEDQSGNIWLGTYAGLDLFIPENDSFKHFDKKDGLSNEVIYGILEDDEGNLWMSTNDGINKFNTKTNTFIWFSAEDGLQGQEFNTGAYHKGLSGKMYFGGVNGFNVFYPKEIQENTIIPSVVLTEFLLFNKPLDINDTTVLNKSINEIDKIILEHDDYIFGFEFSALNFRQPEHNQFAYKLEGFDENWTYTDYKYRRATYTNIPSGTYEFKVKASNDDGYWNEEGVSVTIQILPPWWLTWWANTLYIIIPICLFILFYKLRVSVLKTQKINLEDQVKIRTIQLLEQKEELKINNERLLELNEEKDGILDIVAHDLRGPFNRIQGLTQLLTINKKVDSDQMEYIEKINSSISHGCQLIRDLLDVHSFNQESLHIEEVDIEKLLAELKEHTLQEIDKKQQNLIIKSTLKNSLVYTDRMLLWRLLENLLSNASKYSPQRKTIIISVTKKNGDNIFSIKDEGLGFSDEDKEKMFGKFQKLSAKPTGDESSTGLGLSIVKIITDRLQGSIEVMSELEVGSEFIITLPDLPLNQTE
ncbi:MAG: ATP-binding protein [Cyclobacteriaceae bacterium]|nr:ATP-binding protein [Cyclobacteriaceae bacterium]